MGKIVIYCEDGTIEELERDKPPALEEVQAWVGGYIEAVPGSMTRDRQAWCNEEGLVMGMAPNLNASLAYGVTLVGPVVSLRGRDVVLD